MIYMKELAIEKIELLLNDLKKDHEKEKEEGKNYFNTDLMAIRVKEIYKILKEVNKMSEEEKKKISVNEEDIQNFINCYKKDIEYIMQLEKENKQLKDNWNKLKEELK